MIRSYNPITKTVSSTEGAPITVTPLQQLCRNTILNAVTLKRIHKYKDLPLPAVLSKKISILNLQDFIIDVEKIGPQDHIKQTYNATCIFDNREVIIKVLSKDSQHDTSSDNPDFILAFEEDEIVCCIYEPTESLGDNIKASREKGTTFQETFIWKTIAGLAQEFKTEKYNPLMKISTSTVRFHSTGEMFLEVPMNTGDTGHMTEVGGGMDSAVYEAPEVLGRQDCSEAAFSWTIGCIIYEMLALEPAYFDRSGTNPFSVFMDIMQGTHPPEPQEGSNELREIMHQCLTVDPNQRPNLDNILQACQQFLQTH
ncbi:hypothetical protein FSP39_018830 [Pinctada imbricata]|uniref:non-specific serine/threonine protein kinase n=1 Tax=Pinctada imbricata TaxID=66713 RepID=A0AA88XJG5_PINIB|nr:hypothetical protein FSP39_018830 [Pinctada imbricata]